MATAPLFGCPEQLSTDALTVALAADRDFRNLAIDQLPVHWIGRPFKPGIYEANDLAPDFRDKRDGGCTASRWMLAAFPVAFRYSFDPGCSVTLTIEAGVILSAFEEYACNSASIVSSSWTDGDGGIKGEVSGWHARRLGSFNIPLALDNAALRLVYTSRAVNSRTTALHNRSPSITPE